MKRRRKTPPPILLLGLVVLLLGIGWLGDWYLSQSSPAQVAIQPNDSSPTSNTSEISDGADPLETLAAIQAQRRIVNVHEHVQRLEDAERLLRVMDNFGVGKTILVGSSWFTITLNEAVGFTRYDEMNVELIRIVQKYPERFEAWPTINPNDEDKLEKLRQMHRLGATGLKLYLGHGYVKRSDGKYMFHVMALDDPSMLPIYAYCQENYLPICFHVQPHGGQGPGIAEEFVTVLTMFPDMKVIAPHFILSSIRASRLREFLDTFPNLYSDVSFGHDSFLSAGLKRISENPQKFIDLFEDYPTRFMWGTDLVITEYEGKSEEWMAERFQAYLDMLTKNTYVTPVVPEEPLQGLQLRGDLLERVLYRNFEEMKASRPDGTRIIRRFDWTNTGVEPTGRRAGQMLPPPAR